MTPPFMSDRSMEVDGKTYTYKPVMLVYYYLEEAQKPGNANQFIPMLHKAISSGMLYHHTEEEVIELMGKLTAPDIIEWLIKVPDMQEAPAEENFPDLEDEIGKANEIMEQINDSFLTSPPTGARG